MKASPKQKARRVKSSAGHMHGPSYMTLQNLEQIARDAQLLASQIDPSTELEGWVEDLVSQAKTHLNSVRNYMQNGAEVELVQLGAATGDAPNLRKADGDHTCANCKFFEDDHCTQFDFSPAPNKVCDDWVALNKVGAAEARAKAAMVRAFLSNVEK